MAKFLVETYYTCSFKVSHYLDDIDEKNLQNIEKRDDGKFEILDVKLDSRKTKNLEKIEKNKIDVIEKSNNVIVKASQGYKFLNKSTEFSEFKKVKQLETFLNARR